MHRTRWSAFHLDGERLPLDYLTVARVVFPAKSSPLVCNLSEHVQHVSACTLVSAFTVSLLLIRPDFTAMRLSALFATAALWAATASAADQCTHYGLPEGDECTCPAGFGASIGSQCDTPQCGGSLCVPGPKAKEGNLADCQCDAGWTGPTCTGESRLQLCASSL